jgi:hypothetical protein
MRRLSLALVLLLVGGSLLADAVSDVLRSDLARERRRLAADVTSLADVTRRLEAAVNDLAAAARSVADNVGKADVSPEDIQRREDAVSAAEGDVRTLLDRRRLVAERIVERRRNVALLAEELRSKARPAATADLLSGKWNVTMDPGEQRGVFHLSLDNTIVSGDYTLEGGFSGSLRGTLVGDRLRMERVDSQLGFIGIFYGRLARDGSSVAGTWESTTFGVGAAGQGKWRAVPIREEGEETP